MKKINKQLILLLASFSLFSCDDYLDINTSPNSPDASLVSPELSLAGSLTQPHRSFVVEPNRLGNIFMNSWGGNVNSFTGIFVNEFDLNIDNGFYSRIWENLYLTTLVYDDILRYESNSHDNHKAIAKIMKTYYYQYLVDLYGDIPYYQAHDVAIPSPAYDDAQTIYRSLAQDLDDAIAMIDNAPSNSIVPTTSDVVFHGDMEKWQQLANTIKLRLLIRESGLPASQTYIAEEIQDIADNGHGYITEDVTINPGYSSGSNEQQNPFYNTFGYQIDELTPRSGYSSVRATKHVVDFLDGTTTGVADARISRIFDFATNGVTTLTSYNGVVQGQDGLQADDFLSPLGQGLVKNSAQDGYLFTLSEAYFLQSEAAFRGYIAGDAKALFENGISASFDLLGAANFANYLAASTNVDKIGWDGSANKIEAIMTQKWIALNGINGIESWIEYNRTGFPFTPLAITASRPAKPNRLMYPASEYVSNSANVPVQTQDDIFTTKIFWDNN